ncbi:MAG: hypothetical protein MI702_13810, partial [Chlorobiales bacterium]|nr:hypothetical protein [Chlorobiales bacterium]
MPRIFILFASANFVHIEELQRAGYLQTFEGIEFAGNEIGLVSAVETPVDDFSLLGNEDLFLVMPLPEVPAGSYALEALEQLNAIYGA